MPPFAAARAHAGCFAARTDCRTTHWHAGLRLAALREHAERVLQLERHDAGGEADGCPQAHAAAVPQEAHPLHAHQGDARNAADTENGAAGACRKGNELPQRVVSLNLREHLDGGLDQGHVVHDRGGDTQQGADGQAAAAAELREELRVVLQHAGGVQRHHRKEHTREEEQAREVRALERGRNARGGRGRARLSAGAISRSLCAEAQRVRGEPHEAQGQQHAQVRRQGRAHLQHRDHEDEGEAQAQRQHLRLRRPLAPQLLARVQSQRLLLLRLLGRLLRAVLLKLVEALAPRSLKLLERDLLRRRAFRQQALGPCLPPQASKR
mmetsp:Transcript_21114/g.66771  ORF Transcript_21114/g.66771 Transcript_21114/m.66771 type:complete len:324 (-) Transcript_21114:1173-2144(-)